MELQRKLPRPTFLAASASDRRRRGCSGRETATAAARSTSPRALLARRPRRGLATETVLQLARAVDGIRYGERRLERVKGLAEPVTAVTVLQAGRWWRRTGAMVAAELALVAVLVAAAVALLGGGCVLRRPAAGRCRVGRLLSPTGEVEASVPAGGTGDLALLRAHAVAGQLQQQDARAHRRAACRLLHPFVSIQNGFGGTTAGFGAVWAVDGRDPVLAPRRSALPDDRPHPAADPEGTRSTSPHRRRRRSARARCGSPWPAEVFHVDPRSRRVVATIDVPEADLLAYGDGKLWVAQSDLFEAQRDRTGPANTVVSSVTLRNFIDALAVSSGCVATSTPGDGVEDQARRQHREDHPPPAARAR